MKVETELNKFYEVSKNQPLAVLIDDKGKELVFFLGWQFPCYFSGWAASRMQIARNLANNMFLSPRVAIWLCIATAQRVTRLKNEKQSVVVVLNNRRFGTAERM